MDSGKPRLAAVPSLGLADPRLEIAATLERIAAQLRAGEVQADIGVLVMGNHADNKLHPPCRLGKPSRATDILGLLSYAQTRVYLDDIE